MSSKKLMAAAMASIMAVGTVSTVAFADEAATAATKDEYTLELVPGTYQQTVKGKTTAHITASIKSGDIKNLLIPANTNVAANQIPSLDSYTEASSVTGNLVTAADDGKFSWITASTASGQGADATPTNVAVNGGITQGATLIKWKDSTATPPTFDTETTIVALGNMNDDVNPYANLAMGLSVKKDVEYTKDDGTTGHYNPTEDDTFEMTNIVLNASIAGKGTDVTYSSAGKEEKADQTRTATGSATYEKIKGGAAGKRQGLYVAAGNTDYLTTGVKGLELSFGLNGTRLLDKIDSANSSFTVSFDISLSNDSWAKLAKAANVKWDETGDGVWNSINVNDLLNKSGDKIISAFLGIEGTSVLDWATAAAGSEANLQLGHLEINALGKTVATDVKEGEDKQEDKSNYFNHGVNQSMGNISYEFFTNDIPVNIQYGITKQNVFKNLNAGGTVTFEFDKEFRDQDSFNPYLMFRTAGGLINPPVHLEYMATSADNKSITFSYPAGMTWDADTTNPMKNFELDYNLGYINTLAAQANSGAYQAGVGYDGDTYKSYFHMKDAGHLVKITFKADGSGAAVDNNSGSTNSGNNSGNNGGNTTSGTKDPNGNPPTGVALAIAPVILAAGAVVAVSASKKRK